MKSKINEINIYKTVLLAILLLTIAHYTIDLILTLRYTFVIEGKVGALLLQFVII